MWININLITVEKENNIYLQELKGSPLCFLAA